MALPAPSADDKGEVTMGLIREAIAFRVKCRIGEVRRHNWKLHLEMMCMQKDNRGGVYPMPLTVANLGIGLFQDGFIAAEAHHEGVCARNPRVSSTKRLGDFLSMEQKKCSGHDACEMLSIRGRSRGVLYAFPQPPAVDFAMLAVRGETGHSKRWTLRWQMEACPG